MGSVEGTKEYNQHPLLLSGKMNYIVQIKKLFNSTLLYLAFKLTTGISVDVVELQLSLISCIAVSKG